MGNPRTTIELNGKRYDARTGEIIGEAAQVAPAVTPKAKQTGSALDGFSKRPNVLASAQDISTPKPTAKISKASVNPAKRTPQKAQTLMRTAVKKPKPVVKNDIQPVKKPQKPAHIHSSRQSRASHHAKSPMVSKFGSSAVRGVTKKQAHIPVVNATQPAQKASSQSNQISERIKSLEAAVQNSTSHLQKLEKDTVRKAGFLSRVGFRNKFANVAAMSVAVLMLTGFFAYQNKAMVEMRVAATKSGVSAKLPGYKPSGYGMAGAVKAEPGKVSIGFVSRTDTSKNFTISQQASNWSSSSLLANHVSTNNKPYQSYQDSGKTIYIYDNSNATWVDKGIWYQIEGNANLSSDQLLRIANSL